MVDLLISFMSFKQDIEIPAAAASLKNLDEIVDLESATFLENEDMDFREDITNIDRNLGTSQLPLQNPL